jgi:hypothetical protein
MATASILREHLKGRLPAYMIPASITLISTMPRIPKGNLSTQKKYSLRMYFRLKRPYRHDITDMLKQPLTIIAFAFI